jgi:hypothetical protein
MPLARWSREGMNNIVGDTATAKSNGNRRGAVPDFALPIMG